MHFCLSSYQSCRFQKNKHNLSLIIWPKVSLCVIHNDRCRAASTLVITQTLFRKLSFYPMWSPQKPNDAYLNAFKVIALDKIDCRETGTTGGVTIPRWQWLCYTFPMDRFLLWNWSLWCLEWKCFDGWFMECGNEVVGFKDSCLELINYLAILYFFKSWIKYGLKIK